MESRTMFGMIVGGILALAMLLAFLTVTPKGECKETTYILKGVNGITDENSGLMSGGDVERTSLLMDTGRIITLSYRIKHLYLGQPITIKECKSLIGGEIIEVNQ